MDFKLIEVWIKGITPQLQHKFGIEEETELTKATRRVHLKRPLPREAAQQVVYMDAQGEVYFPGNAISACMREQGSSHKQKGSRKSLKYVIPSAVLVEEENVPMFDLPPNGKATTPTRLKDFEVDTRPVRIRSTGGTILRHRPRFDQWAAKFTLRINENLMDIDTVHQILEEAGQQQGLMDYRPNKGGRYGMFSVVGWREINA